MDDNDLMLTALNDIKCSIKELRDEIKSDIQAHKKDNSDDIQRLYNDINRLKETTTILDTKIKFWQWFGSVGMVGVTGSVMASIMQLILK